MISAFGVDDGELSKGLGAGMKLLGGVAQAHPIKAIAAGAAAGAGLVGAAKSADKHKVATGALVGAGVGAMALAGHKLPTPAPILRPLTTPTTRAIAKAVENSRLRPL